MLDIKQIEKFKTLKIHAAFSENLKYWSLDRLRVPYPFSLDSQTLPHYSSSLSACVDLVRPGNNTSRQ